MSTRNEPVCRFLEWDSAFFGRRIARLAPQSLTPRLLTRALRWCETHSIDCLYALVGLDDPHTLRLCENQSFHCVDLRVMLDRRLDRTAIRWPRTAACPVRPARSHEIPALKAIAGVIHRDSRFFQDSRFPRARCRRLYEVWVAKSCEDNSGIVLVPEWKGKPAGYSACLLQDRGQGQISLFGIAPSAQGRGIGGRLLGESLSWFAAQGVSRVSVVTQGRNIPSQRLYQRFGFRTASVHAWCHRWFSE